MKKLIEYPDRLIACVAAILSGASILAIGIIAYIGDAKGLGIGFMAGGGTVALAGVIALPILGYKYYNSYYKEMSDEDIRNVKTTIESHYNTQIEKLKEQAKKIQKEKERVCISQKEFQTTPL